MENNTKHTQDESLNYAAIFFANKLHGSNTGDYRLHDKNCFISGANWQSEKDKVIIDKLIEALKNNFDIVKGLSVIFYKELQEKKTPENKEIYPIIKQEINSTLELLNSLNIK